MENQNRRTYLDAQSILYYENLIFRYSSPELVKRAKKLKIQKAVTEIGLKILLITIVLLCWGAFVIAMMFLVQNPLLSIIILGVCLIFIKSLIFVIKIIVSAKEKVLHKIRKTQHPFDEDKQLKPAILPDTPELQLVNEAKRELGIWEDAIKIDVFDCGSLNDTLSISPLWVFSKNGYLYLWNYNAFCRIPIDAIEPIYGGKREVTIEVSTPFPQELIDNSVYDIKIQRPRRGIGKRQYVMSCYGLMRFTIKGEKYEMKFPIIYAEELKKLIHSKTENESKDIAL